MPRTLLLIGTRKGLFLLESETTAATGSVRGPFCESWPVYHAVHDAGVRARSTPPPRANGTARPSGAAPTSARRGRTRARASPTTTATAQDLEGLDARRDGRPRPRRRRGAGHLREPRRRRELVAADDARGPAGQRGLGRPGEPAARPSRHLGAHARRRRRVALLDDRPGDRPVRDEPTTGRPGRRATGACAPTGRASTRRSASASTGSSARRADPSRMYQQNHVGMHRSDDGGHSWTEITDGLPSEFGFAAAGTPARPRHVLRDPARPGPRALHAGRAGGRVAHARRRLELAAARPRPAAATTRTSACSERR